MPNAFSHRFFLLFVFLSSPALMASTPFKTTLDVKKNSYLGEGVFTGGKAGTGASILAVRRQFSAKLQLERIIVDMGDRDAKPAGKNMGFFQASMDSANNRIILDISQLRLSKVSETQVQRLFKNDAYVSSVAFTMDPEDKAATLVLNLKRPMRLEVFQLLKDKMPARIVMDLVPRMGHL